MSIRAIAVGVTGAIIAMASSPGAQVQDHLKCYKVKDPLKVVGTVDADSLQFGLDPGCTVSKAKLVCVPASDTNVAVQDKLTGPITPLPVSGPAIEGDQVCYKLKCPALPPDQQVTDQFGTRTFTKFKSSLLCTPAVTGTEYCGDGTRNASESCDGADLGGETCQSLGFQKGVLACGAGCALDTSGCACGAFPATGQTTCWQPGSVTVVACAGRGVDGDVRAGATLSYTNNGDGTITDNNTGLMWEAKSNDGGLHDKDNEYDHDGYCSIDGGTTCLTNADCPLIPQPFPNPPLVQTCHSPDFQGGDDTAFEWVARLNSEGGTGFAGYTDWRLPNVKELDSIVDYEEMQPAIAPAFNTLCPLGCKVTGCSCTHYHGQYWTTTRDVGDLSAGNVWIVDFSDGFRDSTPGAAPRNVRAVRGGL